MPTLTPKNPAPTRGLNHYDGAPLILAASPAEALTSAEDRTAARYVLAELARIEGENRCTRARLARLAKEREEARRLAAPTASPFPPATPERAERFKRAQLLKGANTRESARIAAEHMTARKLFPTLPDAMQALARKVSESIPLPDAAPEHILSAWLTLDPNPLET
jgi:hypothetical protein